MQLLYVTVPSCPWIGQVGSAPHSFKFFLWTMLFLLVSWVGAFCYWWLLGTGAGWLGCPP